MPAALKITLTSEENQILQELEVAQKGSRRTKQRATALSLNAKGMNYPVRLYGGVVHK